MSTYEILAPAKVNLTLHVLGRRPDGFHDLATWMVPLSLADRLEIRPAAATRVTVPGHAELEGDDNLCTKAVRAFSARIQPAQAEIVLHKEIPIAAGLGGGSSDAAAVLRVLAHHHGVATSDPRLHAAALDVGSDVPFFLDCTPALARGRGELLEKAPALATQHLVIVKPPYGVSAGEAYGALAKLRAEGRLPSGSERPLPPAVNDLAPLLHNDLQAAVATLRPIAELVARLEACRPAGVLMSGSGSCVFAVARTAEEARNCSESFPVREGERVVLAETLQGAPPVRET